MFLVGSCRFVSGYMAYLAVRVGSCRAFFRARRFACHACRPLPPKAARPDTHDTKPHCTKENPAPTDTNRHGTSYLQSLRHLKFDFFSINQDMATTWPFNWSPEQIIRAFCTICRARPVGTGLRAKLGRKMVEKTKLKL